MDAIVLFDPGIRSLNKGDEIIMESAEEELEKAGILKNNYIIHSATHAPVVTFYQNTRKNPRMRFYDNAKYKFICGSNLLWKNMLKPRPVLNVNLWNCLPYKNSILLGVGTGLPNGRTDSYTKLLYSKILSKEYTHSVRDQSTADFLNNLGYKAINTGCPTMWRFTPEFCAEIPCKKAENVIFTLTDYGRNPEYDQRLIDILLAKYKKTYFWIQGAFDFEYFNTLKHTDSIIVVPPVIKEFSKVLDMPDVEYVGTRLHAGLYAMQHKKRAIIIAIDNRVRDLNRSYHLQVVERKEIELLPEIIESDFYSNIQLNKGNIESWLSQFVLE